MGLNINKEGVLKGNLNEIGPKSEYLVGWWKLDGDTYDKSDYMNDGINNGATISDGLGQSAYEFDGSSKIVISNNNALQVIGSLTISMWLYPTNFSARRNPINKAYGGEYTITQETNGTINFYWGTSGSNSSPYQGLAGAISLNLNNWNHICISRDLENMTLKSYINTTLDASTSAYYTEATPSNSDVIIGDGYTNYYNGKIQDVRIYNTALTSEDVKLLYNLGSSQKQKVINKDGLIYTQKSFNETL